MSRQSEARRLEPWMRGTHGDLDPVLRAVVHALELAEEDVSRWCNGLSDAEMFRRPEGVAPVAFHLRHMARSLDRLLTYAEKGALESEERREEERRGVERRGEERRKVDREEGERRREERRGGERRRAGLLSEAQLAALRTELETTGTAEEVLTEFRAGLAEAKRRVERFRPESFGEARGIGRMQLPTTVAGLLIHCAEHTSRHVGQAVTTAKLVRVADGRVKM
jgi:hypothetical protein